MLLCFSSPFTYRPTRDTFGIGLSYYTNNSGPIVGDKRHLPRSWATGKNNCAMCLKFYFTAIWSNYLLTVSSEAE